MGNKWSNPQQKMYRIKVIKFTTSTQMKKIVFMSQVYWTKISKQVISIKMLTIINKKLPVFNNSGVALIKTIDILSKTIQDTFRHRQPRAFMLKAQMFNNHLSSKILPS